MNTIIAKRSQLMGWKLRQTMRKESGQDPRRISIQRLHREALFELNNDFAECLGAFDRSPGVQHRGGCVSKPISDYDLELKQGLWEAVCANYFVKPLFRSARSLALEGNCNRRQSYGIPGYEDGRSLFRHPELNDDLTDWRDFNPFNQPTTP